MSSRSRFWDRTDLQRRLRHALEIAHRALDHLGDSGYHDSVQPENNVPPDKLIAETAFLLLAAATSSPSPEMRALIDQLARELIPYARSGRVLLSLTLRPALALDYAHAHICLSRLGFVDPVFDEHLRRIDCARVSASRERVPYRMLEQTWTRKTWQSAVPAPRTSGATGSLRTILSTSFDIFGATTEDAYAFTHSLIYLRNFNIDPLPLPRPRALILAEAEAALACTLDEQDYDVSGELLLAWPLTGKSWSAASSFAFSVLTQVEDAAGFLPAAATRLSRIEQLQGPERKHYVLATAYHTAYVMGLLCALALQPGRLPPAKIPVVSCIRGSADRLMRLLEDRHEARYWNSAFAKLTVREQDSLSPFLLTVALHRALKLRDFVAVGQLLEFAHSHRLSDTPACGQAAELLERVSHFANLSKTYLANAAAPSATTRPHEELSASSPASQPAAHA